MNNLCELAGELILALYGDVDMDSLVLEPCFTIPVVKMKLDGHTVYADSDWISDQLTDPTAFDITKAVLHSEDIKKKYYNPRMRLQQLTEDFVSILD